MNKSTAAGLRAACSQVLGVQENWESVDVKTLDIEEALTRFQHLRKKDFKPSVLKTYRQRFQSAVESFLRYQMDPAVWKPRASERPANKERAARGDREAVEIRPVRQEMPQTGMVEYPFPLRAGQIVRLALPRDLKSSEVDRLHAFMRTLAVDFEAAETKA
ncbi:MAG TPA: hypothetical protein VFI25_18375 [Planctomycetota bacterium]|nr:hypothetical protein [Planctomycetota bacterium]